MTRATSSGPWGTVSESMGDELEQLQGDLAIGHTRYSTAGSSTIENAQPIFVQSRGGYIALAHNGNLVNAVQVRAELEAGGSIFSTNADSEVIVHRLAKSHAPTPAARMAEALTGLEGAYSLVAAIGHTLIAARDPRGWRPLVMGRLNGAVVFASETCALDIVGAVAEREVAPGEIVVVDDAGVQFVQALEAKPTRKCVFEYVYFARPDSRVFGGSVDRARRELGRQLAQGAPGAQRRPGVQRPRLVEFGGARIRGGERPALRAGPDPEPLHRPHVHSADPGGA